MRGFSLIILFLGIQLVISDTNGDANSKELNSDDYDDDSDDLDDSPDDQDFQVEEKRPFYVRKKQTKDRVKEIYLSWDLDLCKDVQCKPNQVCLVKMSRKSAVCVPKKSIDKKKAQSKKEFKWSSNKKSSYKVSSPSSIIKLDSQVLPRDSSSYLPSPSSSSSSTNNKSWKDCRPCPVTKPSFYCGTDNSTYSSMCRLQFHNCVHQTDVEVACKGFCPCDGSPVGFHDQAKEYRNHERWNKYMDTLNKLRRSRKIEKFVKSRTKAKLENDGVSELYHEGGESRKLNRKGSSSCNKSELKSMGNRLSDWFAVVLRDQKRSFLSKKDTFMDSLTILDCPKDIENIFHRLDLDKDLRLSLKELYDLEHDKREKCLKQYLDGCDEDRDSFLNPYEWCSCFDRKSKPCLIEKSQRKRFYGEYVPKCDKEGFYQSIQCHLHKCWCVDRYGVEISGTRQVGIPNCDSKNVTRRKGEKHNSNSLTTGQINNRKEEEFDDSDDSDDSEDDSLDGSGYEP